MRLDITIRAANEQDYPTIVAISRSATTDYVQSVEDLLAGDHNRPATALFQRIVAVNTEQQIVGTAYSGQSAPAHDPRRFYLWLFVRPDRQGQGIGKRLYEQMLAQLAAYHPTCLETGVRTDLPRAVRFLTARGFVEVSRECETHLDLTTFAPDAFLADQQRVAQAGIILKTLAELEQDPMRDAKLYALHLQRQQAGMEAADLPVFDQWQLQFWQTPRLLAEGFCVALDGDQYIGQSNALTSGVASELEYGYTGVLPAYRNRGIARAMKLHVLRWAKTQGYTLVRSFSDSGNEAMIRVNLHLGFTVQPPVLWLNKVS